MARDKGTRYCPMCGKKDIRAQYRFMVKHVADGILCASRFVCTQHAYVLRDAMRTVARCALHDVSSTGHVVP